MKKFLSLLLGLIAFIGVHAQESDVAYPESVWLENPNLVFRNYYPGSYDYLDVRFSPDSDEINKDMTWTFSNEGIVNIECWFSGYFVIQGVQFGTTTFTGTTVNGLEVTGTATVEGIRFENYYYSMSIGQTVSLGVTTSSDEILNAITWQVDNDQIISISNGEITALTAGTTSFRAIAEVDGYKYETNAYVTVYPDAGTVAMQTQNVNMQTNTWGSIDVLFPEGENYSDGTWSSSDENIVKIDGYGNNWCTLYGVSDGTAVVTYTAPNGASTSCTVNVYTWINDFSLNASDKDLIPDETFQIEIEYISPEDAGQRFIYTSDNEDVATVDENGLVTAVGYGETYINVYPEYQTWQQRYLKVNVSKMPESVSLGNTDININYLNSWFYLDVQFTPSDDVNKNLDWTYSEDGIVEIANWGNGFYVIRGLNFGTVTITGTTPNGLTVEGTVTVSGIKFENTEYSLSVGESVSLGVTASSEEIQNALYWLIGNPDIVSVSEDGTLTGLAPGQTSIEACASVNYTWYSTTVNITVYPEVGNVALVETSVNLESNSWTTLSVLLPEGEDDYDGTWSSSDENIVRIDGYYSNWCSIQAMSPGTAVVTYTAANGASASCTVNVYTYINDFSLNASDITLGTGETFQIEITTDPEDAEQNFTYYSVNENIATVDSNGLVTAVKPGNTFIQVYPELQNYPVRNLYVQVGNQPEGITAIVDEINLSVGEVVTYAAKDLFQIEPSDDVDESLSVYSNNDYVLSVWSYTEDGEVYINFYGVSTGETGITAYTSNWYSAYIPVTVGNVPLRVTLNETNCTINFLEKLQLTATVSPADRDAEVTWSSSNTMAAVVDNTGLVTGIGSGTAIITATATDQQGNIATASCTVKVNFSSGVEEILEDDETCDVYSIDGIVMKKDATSDYLKSLHKGVYVIRKGNLTFKIKI